VESVEVVICSGVAGLWRLAVAVVKVVNAVAGACEPSYQQSLLHL